MWRRKKRYETQHWHQVVIERDQLSSRSRKLFALLSREFDVVPPCAQFDRGAFSISLLYLKQGTAWSYYDTTNCCDKFFLNIFKSILKPDFIVWQAFPVKPISHKTSSTTFPN
jgi:hypothetical protein